MEQVTMDLRRESKYLFLDGLRGLCAVFIALYHAQLFTGHGFNASELALFLQPVSYLLGFGHYSISVFIVLSGFCLTIPVAKSGGTHLRGGFKTYLSRRAFRILPPYYFALGFFLLLILAVPALQNPAGTAWDSKIPITTDAILSHLFLIHNFSREWFLKINGPMWSVATEWQIYFIFPVLLYVWRRFNIVISLATAIFLGYASMVFGSANYKMEWAHPWYLALFAFGMVSAIITFSPDIFYSKLRASINWGLFGTLALVLLPFFVLFNRFVLEVHIAIAEAIVGILCCLIIIRYTLIETRGLKKPFMLKLLNTRAAVNLGKFSYSIYLIHSPFLALINLSLLDIPLNTNLRFMVMETLGVAMAIAISYVFYLLVESRFNLTKFKPTTSQLTTEVSNQNATKNA
jgi:peptidoglycan/LPS O-acetylase OafA/YrhL